MNNNSSLKESYLETLLHRNPLLIRLIGLSPMLAISYTLTLSLSMGIIFFIVMVMTSLLASATRDFIPPPAALACYVLFSATIVTIIDLLMQAWLPDLRTSLGLYLPIVAANCLIIDRTLVFAARNTIMSSFKDATVQSFSVLFVLFLLGSFRELIGYGSLLKDMFLITGNIEHVGVQLIKSNQGFTLASLPAGGFILLGLLIAAASSLRTKTLSVSKR